MKAYQFNREAISEYWREVEMQNHRDELILIEIATDANERFGHRRDREQLVQSTVEVAREMLARRPLVTDYIGEIAIATSRAERGRIFAINSR